MLLVLDDYHLISSQPVHASLGYLLEHRPPGLHLLLSSRSDRFALLASAACSAVSRGSPQG